MGTLYRTDPVLRLIDHESMPDSFRLLPDEEQRWRGRFFLMARAVSGSTAYAWAMALADGEPHNTDAKATVDGIPDDRLLAGMRAAEPNE